MRLAANDILSSSLLLLSTIWYKWAGKRKQFPSLGSKVYSCRARYFSATFSDMVFKNLLSLYTVGFCYTRSPQFLGVFINQTNE